MRLELETIRQQRLNHVLHFTSRNNSAIACGSGVDLEPIRVRPWRASNNLVIQQELITRGVSKLEQILECPTLTEETVAAHSKSVERLRAFLDGRHFERRLLCPSLDHEKQQKHRSSKHGNHAVKIKRSAPGTPVKRRTKEC